MVAAPELPDDAAQYVRCLAEAGYFEAVSFTPEDRDRAQQYAANAEREGLLGSAESMDEFLRGLNMSVVFGPFTSVDHARVVQLINKTNQFNTTTRRYASEEVAHSASLPEALTLQFRLIDRVGDNGLVSTMILRPTPGDEDALEIENWVMSCRVFGRELEYEAMNIAVDAARGRGVRALVGNYIPTPKNDVIKTLYPNLGFTEVNQSAPANGATAGSSISLSSGILTSLCKSSRMTDQEILSKFTRILRDLLLDNSIELTMETRREDVPNWDSFNYINFIVSVEIEFGVQFKVADVESFANLGAIVKETAQMVA
jgi:predicted enzyme involved in methoxymalonyl-ACP biosynthesis/acyl carrier protein